MIQEAEITFCLSLFSSNQPIFMVRYGGMRRRISDTASKLRRFSLLRLRGLLCMLLFLLAFFSCSNPVQDAEEITANSTLRYSAESLYDATEWAEEIEFDRLTASVSSVEGISARLNLSPLIVLASVPSDSTRIFPNLEGFGSLDTTLISKRLREMLTSFCECIAANKEADKFMESNCLFSLALFYEDFERIFASCFDFSDEQDSSETAYFDSFVLGEPFLDGVYYEVPVKFFGKKANLTLCVFCFEKSSAWKIDQIQIVDWEILDGKN